MMQRTITLALALVAGSSLAIPALLGAASQLPRVQPGAVRNFADAAAPQPSDREQRLPGIIDFGDDRTAGVVTAPPTVRAGEDLQVTISTFGGGCERLGDHGVTLTESIANVMVYDFTTATRPGVICTMILKRMPHAVTLRFTKPGPALIRVWGRRVGGPAPPMGTPTVLEQRVMVQ